MHKWNIFKEFDDASKAAANFIANKIQEFIQKNGICHVALSGGKSPARCLNYLAKQPLAWGKVHWYLADERCYPQGHAERNDRMLKENLWSLISPANVHVIPAELGAEQAAEIYRKVINKIECIDIAFLGIGEDGHTASLFPGNAALFDIRSVVPVYDSPKPPGNRVSLSMDSLKNTACRIVLAGGEGKEPIISRIKAGESLPINSLGDIDWFIDEAAVSTNSL